MRKPQGRSGPLLLVLACVMLAAATGCKEEFSDDAFGVLDLSPVYDGGTRTNPARGLPRQISPSNGFVDEQQIEYYDFGVIPVVQRDPNSGRPLSVEVRPMYFFFTPQGFPLFSAPVRDTRDGADWMRGGKNTLNPNPKDFCAGVPPDQQKQNPCSLRNASEKKRPYPVRERDPLVDGVRKVADYQRPLIDATPADQGAQPYTGFWEIIEITAPADYEPDAIKHVDTLNRAVASGKFLRRTTQKVINCPMIDERTSILQGVTDRPTPHPRIEVWYRRRLAFCFLANGWETLGNDKGQLLYAGSDDQRVDTFDVARVTFGTDKVQQTRLVVPVQNGYTPAIFTSDQSGAPPSITRIADNALMRGLPRHHPADPPGYTPVRWMWDLVVENDYQSGALTSVDQIDQGITQPYNAFAANFVPVVRNLAVRGPAVKCSLPPVAGRSPKVCGKEVPNPDDATRPLIDARGDTACTSNGLECNKNTCFCDAPFVGYGQACGAGVAQCNPEKDALSDNGYGCFPAFGGFCYLGCNPSTPNMRSMENMGKKANELRDSRCKDLPGLVCLGYNGGGLCLKLCDLNITEGDQCAASVPVEGGSRNLGESQACQDYGIEVCTWPDTYTPS
jgi:hypothetical protein